MNQLEKIEKLTAVEVFKSGNVENIIGQIEAEVRSFVPDLKTDKSRKSIASLAAKVSKSKVMLDGLGKNLVSEWKEKAKAVDAERKIVRDRLDALRDETRKPLTEWEEAEKARVEKELLDKQIAEAYEQAIIENELFDMRKAEADRKFEQELIEAERIEKERIEAEAKAKEERERKIAEDAAKAAQEEAERKAKAEKEAAEQAIINAKAEAELERQKAKEAAELAERNRLRAIKDAEEKAKREAEEKERARLAEETRIKAAEEKKAANLNHRKKVNNGILKALVDIGIDEKTGKKIIEKTVKGEIPCLSVNY